MATDSPSNLTILHGVWAQRGEYESYGTWLIALYEDRNKAIEHARKADAWAKKRAKEMDAHMNEDAPRPTGRNPFDTHSFADELWTAGTVYSVCIEVVCADPDSFADLCKVAEDLRKEHNWEPLEVNSDE